jgi:hypothetical protein
MSGVNVAKSNLYLHFLETLEFRIYISVTSWSGRGHQAATSHPPSSHGSGRFETQGNNLPNPSVRPILFQGWSLKMIFGWQTEGSHASTLVRVRFLFAILNLGANELPIGCLALVQPGSRDSDGGAEPMCQSCSMFLFCSIIALSPPFSDD